jgi:hypothetical protein
VNRLPLTASADLEAEMPERAADRLDRIARALASLEKEERRLLRLGFEIPLARCHQELRYWRFLDGICSLAHEQRSAASDERHRR